MNEIKKPNNRTFWEVTNGTDVTHQGVTEINQVTTTGLPTIISDTNADVIFPALPDSGFLNEGEIYSYLGDMVEVRQSHERTEFPPNLTPALFSIYRANTEGMEWVQFENVIAGDERTYDGKTYKCIQSHFTEFTPDLTPALWNVVAIPNDEWQVGVAYEIGNEVLYDGDLYICIQAHTSISVWTPPAVPALWNLVEPII